MFAMRRGDVAHFKPTRSSRKHVNNSIVIKNNFPRVADNKTNVSELANERVNG